MNRAPESIAIAASAGYGKTEILCMRLLAILLMDPQNRRRTAAMTFSRAAAGEILERTLSSAAYALTSPKRFAEFQEKMAELNENNVFLHLTEAELAALLQQLCHSVNELAVSTIDSFMISMAGSCAMELGFFRPPAVLDPEQVKVQSGELLRTLFAAPDQEIAELCKELLIGNTDRVYAEACRSLLEELDPYSDLFPEIDFWGAIPGPLAMTPLNGLQEALDICDHAPPGTDYQSKLRPLLEHCAAMRSAEDKFTRSERETLNLFFEVWDDFPTVKPAGFCRGWDFTACADAMKLLLSRARDILLLQTGVRTRAAYRLLNRFRELYRNAVWDCGRLQFSDLPRLLSGLPDMDINDLQYRMNLQFRHFLFDEFQDTSRLQWQVFEPIVQDDGTGERSVFLVGDVKQAIYGWRSGDSRLMGEASANMPHRILQQSFRYGQEICHALNTLFMDFLPHCPGIRQSVRTRWGQEYHPHEPHQERPGCFQILNVCTGAPEPDRDFPADAADIITGRLHELAFRERRLSCAVLVRSNQQGVQLRNALAARPEFSADDFVWEGDEKLICSRVTRGLTALLYLLQHPGDSSSAELLRMDQALSKLLPETPQEFAAENALLAESGLTAYLCRCLRRIGPETGPAADALLAAARQFEAANPDCDTARFRDFAAQRRFSVPGLSGKVQIMTIHHSKGLTFDTVFVPCFPQGSGENFLSTPASGILAGKDWLLCNPGPAGLTAPAIRQAAELRAADQQFEALCVLYVALTRARHEVCVLLPNLTADQRKYYHTDLSELKRGVPERRMRFDKVKSYSPRDLLFDAFFGDTTVFPLDQPLKRETAGHTPVLRRQFGSLEWYHRRTVPGAVRQPALFTLPAVGQTLPERPRRAVPNRAGENEAAFRFPSRSNTADGGTAFGTKVHAFFETIGCWRDFVPPDDLAENIRKHFDACQRNPEIAELLSHNGELWREKRFDVILHRNGAKLFLSGCFDRVQIVRDAAGTPRHAEIIDYKSNDVNPETLPEAVEHYTPQMTAYRQALAKMLGMAECDITCTLLFTKLGVLRRIN